MEIKFNLDFNPTVTSQEKGVRVVGGYARFYTKPEVIRQKDLYSLKIRSEVHKQGRAIPQLKGTVRLKVEFGFATPERMKWGCLKATKPDNDNAVKLLIDVLADLGFFEVGDQQIAILEVTKRWSDKPSVWIDIREVSSELFRL